MQAHKHAGFSLIEILIVVAVMGILIAIVIPNLQQAVRNSNDMASRAYISSHVVKGVEAAREANTYKLPADQRCNELTHVTADPKSIATCTYEPDFDQDRYTITVLSVTGNTFRYDGTAIVTVE